MTAIRWPTADLTAQQVRDLLPLARTGDRSAADLLIRSLTPWAIKRARIEHSRHPDADPDDLVQDGLLGAWNAITGYDPDRQPEPGKTQAAWKTYAMTAVARHIKRAAESATAQRLKCPTLDHSDDGREGVHPESPADRPDEQIELVGVVRDALDQLDPADRALAEAVWGIATETAIGLTTRSKTLGLSATRARQNLNRVKEMIANHARTTAPHLCPPNPGPPRPGRGRRLLRLLLRRHREAA